MTAIGLQYLKTISNNTTISQGFNYVTPDEHTFPGNCLFLCIELLLNNYSYYSSIIITNIHNYKLVILFICRI